MPTKGEKDALTGRETTGHEWDGIKELNTPLPKWWLYTFYACILVAIVYATLYPSVPWLHGHFKGLLNTTERTTVVKDIAAATAAQGTLRERIDQADLGTIRSDHALFAFAVAGGKAAFADNCVPCHRSGGAGARGYPNLADDDWLWGGTLADIHQTIEHGVRNDDPDSRQSQMPRFGLDSILTAEEISDVADYVLSLSGNAGPAEAIAHGQKLFADNCANCHGDDAKGSHEVGAPNLSDKIWLYGGDKATVVETITKARSGSMPSWGRRLDPVTIKMLAVYVHSLGGGQ